jgi:hypothetical protein
MVPTFDQQPVEAKRRRPSLARTGEAQAQNAQSTYLSNANGAFTTATQNTNQFGGNIAKLDSNGDDNLKGKDVDSRFPGVRT